MFTLKSKFSYCKNSGNSYFTEISGRDLIAGTRSFGALLEDEGYYAVPSPRQPFPGTTNNILNESNLRFKLFI